MREVSCRFTVQRIWGQKRFGPTSSSSVPQAGQCVGLSIGAQLTPVARCAQYFRDQHSSGTPDEYVRADSGMLAEDIFIIVERGPADRRPCKLNWFKMCQRRPVYPSCPHPMSRLKFLLSSLLRQTKRSPSAEISAYSPVLHALQSPLS